VIAIFIPDSSFLPLRPSKSPVPGIDLVAGKELPCGHFLTMERPHLGQITFVQGTPLRWGKERPQSGQTHSPEGPISARDPVSLSCSFPLSGKVPVPSRDGISYPPGLCQKKESASDPAGSQKDFEERADPVDSGRKIRPPESPGQILA